MIDWEETNWIVWSICGCIWIWNGLYHYHSRKRLAKLQEYGEARKLEMDIMMRDHIVKHSKLEAANSGKPMEH